MKIKQIGKPQIIMSNNDSRHCYFGWPTAARLRDGRIAVAASGFRIAHVCPFGKAVICFSNDDGETYSSPAVVIDTPLDDRDVGLCPFGESGLILTSFNNTTEFQRRWQNDNCNSTEKSYALSYLDTVPNEAHDKYLGSEFKISTDNGVSFGKIFRSPVTSPHGPIELANGKILWVGTEYRKHDWFYDNSDRVLAYTVNSDGTCEYVGEVPQITYNKKPLRYCEPYAFCNDDGTIICHIRMEDTFTLYQTESEDCGKTWSMPHRILPDGGGAPSHIMRHSSGKLIATYGYRTPPYEIRAMISEDGGKTWQTDYTICSNLPSLDIGYPSTVELSDGSLITVFYCGTEKDEGVINQWRSEILQQKWIIE